jgi:hypothetical protein
VGGDVLTPDWLLLLFAVLFGEDEPPKSIYTREIMAIEPSTMAMIILLRSAGVLLTVVFVAIKI